MTGGVSCLGVSTFFLCHLNLSPCELRSRGASYLSKCFKVIIAVFFNVFGLVSNSLSSEIMKDIGEIHRDGELLEVGARHLLTEY